MPEPRSGQKFEKQTTAHQQIYKKLSAFLGHFGSFSVADKLTTHPKNMNLGTEKLSDPLSQIFDRSPFCKFKTNGYYAAERKRRPKTEFELPSVVAVINDGRK